jgi:dolichol-phosphate mannosyltransferase
MGGNNIQTLMKSRSGPTLYISAASVASVVNFLSLNRLERKISQGVYDDLQNLLLIFVPVSLLGLALQFTLARAIGKRDRNRWSLALVPISLIAVFSGILTFLVGSTMPSRTSNAIWMVVTVFSALIPTGILARHLAESAWIQISLYVLSVSGFRFIFWEFNLAAENLGSILASLTMAHICGLLVLVASSKRKQDETKSRVQVRLRHEIEPLSTLLIFGFVVIAGSLSRKSKIGDSADLFSDVSLIGRNLLFIGVLLTYSCIPFLLSHELFSIELKLRFRKAELLIATVTLILTTVALLLVLLRPEFFGIDYQSEEVLMLVISLCSWACLSLSLLPLLFYISHNSRLGWATVVPATGMALAHLLCTSAIFLALSFLACSVLLLTLLLIPARLRNKTTVRVEDPSVFQTDCNVGANITIVIPSHNSGSHGLNTALAIHDLFEEDRVGVHVIAVSDGSRDESVELFNSLKQPWFTHIQLTANQGKGAALRAGLAQSTSVITGFIDADGDIPVHVLRLMHQKILEHDADVVFGSKWHLESNVQVSNSRRLISQLHRTLQQILFKIDISDTQVGVKLFKTSALSEILPSLEESGFSLDVEIFVALAAYGHNNFVETPVEIRRTGASTVSLKSVVVSFIDLLSIFWRARIALRYEALSYKARNSHEMNNR